VKFIALILLFFLQTSYGATLENYLKGIDSLYVSFEEQMELPVAGDEVSLYRGEIFYKRPLKFLWRYTWGSKAFVVSDGEFIETFLGDGECQVSKVNEGLSLFPLLQIVEFPNRIREFYSVKEMEGDSESLFVLKPKRGDSLFSRVELLFKGNVLKEVVTFQSDGTKQVYLIKVFKKNIKIPDSLFRLKKCEEPG